MKRYMKAFIIVIVIMVTMSLNVFADTITPRVSVIPCPGCGSAIRTQEERTLAHSDERFSCIHGYSSGFDHYRVYEVKYVGKCSKCGYDYEYDAGEEHIIFKCDNGAI